MMNLIPTRTMIKMRFAGMVKLGAVLSALGTLLVDFPRCASAEPTPEQTVYWWQDEVRAACFALSRAQAGRVSQWPRMSVAAGTATMPVPRATGPIQADGRLDEEAWKHATSFPVGPIFDRWRDGPLMLRLSACRDEENVYLAIESPRDLTALGALTPEGELFTVGKQSYHVGPGGGLPDGSVARNGDGQVIELALPVRGEVAMTFPVETVRRAGGELPSEFACLGLGRLAAPEASSDFRKLSLWLEPIVIRLLPADTTARLSWTVLSPTEMQLSSDVIEPGKEPVADRMRLTANGEGAVYPYSWNATSDGKTFSVQGFLYLEPVAAALCAVRKMAERSARLGSAKQDAAPSPQEIAALESEAQALSPQDRARWRDLYCRTRELQAQAHLSMLDAPLLFVKRHPYFAGHIYDDYYTWHPGGGIYVVEEPHDPRPGRTVRAVIDPTTAETLGEGVYRDPDLSWDAKRLVFAHRPGPAATTSVYEIGTDGRGLRRLTASEKHHDITPAYLPDDRIVFTSTRPGALVPCFNSGVDTLHTMNADGSDIRSISANNVTEFDPSIMPDGRVLYGRWEYVDKTALYMQSLWTMLPDGRMEEALFGNNLAKPTAILDARPVPGAQRVVASLTPHNGQAVGAIGMIDTQKGKNDLDAVFNFTPEYPVEMDQGLRVGPCDPWPLSEDDVLISNNAVGAHGIIELVDRFGNRELVHGDPEISCYAPMLVKPRNRPPVIRPHTEPYKPGRFLVTDVYQGLGGVERGTIKRIRVVEETARTSGIPPGGRWWNQAFLISWQGGYVVKNILGTVPVYDDGSAYFEVPPGRALYFEVLDEEGREIQRMRTFIEAAAGVTRSCIGCHEYKKSAAMRPGRPPMAMLREPVEPEPESWGSGYIDYPTMVQPIFDKYCVRCHGGTEGMGKGLDFSGGWTWAFNISYETLIKHRLTGFLNCHNSSVHTSEILPPRTIGSGAAPLAEILIKRHPEMSRPERDLLLGWMDTNCNYYGTWDYTPQATCEAILQLRGPLSAAMHEAGCTECHAPGHVGNDWVNLQTPEWSRILRAPMAKSEGGLGLAMCRKRKARTGYPLVDQSVQPPDVLFESRQPEWDPSGDVHVATESTDDPHYRTMLQIIRHARAEALARPRVDMPGAEITPGACRMQAPVPLPDSPPELSARLRPDYAVELSWPRTADTIGLQYELHRGPSPGFTPEESTRLGLTTAGRFFDLIPAAGVQHYALVVTSDTQRTRPIWTTCEVPDPPPPEAASDLAAQSLPGEITLTWEGPEVPGVWYDVYRSEAGSSEFAKLNREPLDVPSYMDLDVEPGRKYAYVVRTLDRRNQQGPASEPAEATPLPEIKEPVFAADFTGGVEARLLDGSVLKGQLHAGAKTSEGALELGSTGFATFKHLPEFDLHKALSLELWVRIDTESPMPVIAACGAFNSTGWFLQRYGQGWRWHLAPISCDGGHPVVGRWVHLVGTFDGRRACLYQDAKLIAQVDCYPNRALWSGPLVVGQYSGQSASYQVQGGISGLKIYHRALRAAEVAEKFQAGRGE